MRSILLTFIVLCSFQMVLNGQGTGDTVRAVFVDEHDVKWFGTDLGLLRYDGTTWSAYNTRLDTPGQVNALAYEDHDSYGSELWIGTDNGVTVSAYSIDGITAATRYSTANSELVSANVSSIALDQHNARYFGTPEGLGIFEGSVWTWLARGWSSGEAGIPNYPLLSLAADKDTVYIGTTSKGAGRVINGVDGFTGASIYEPPYVPIIGTTIKSILTDSKGYQWFGTTDGISQHTSQASQQGWDLYLTTTEGLADNTVNAIFEDSNGDFWFATENGISKYEHPGNIFTNYTTADGLADNKVYDIAEDSDNTLWFATAQGVSSFDGVDFTNYVTSDYAKDFENIVTTNIRKLPAGSTDKLSVYPNPTDSYLYVHYEKEESVYINVSVFDMSGKKINELFNGYAGGGDLKVRWDLNDRQQQHVPGGIYFITVKGEGFSYTRKAVVF